MGSSEEQGLRDRETRERRIRAAEAVARRVAQQAGSGSGANSSTSTSQTTTATHIHAAESNQAEDNTIAALDSTTPTLPTQAIFAERSARFVAQLALIHHHHPRPRQPRTCLPRRPPSRHLEPPRRRRTKDPRRSHSRIKEEASCRQAEARARASQAGNRGVEADSEGEGGSE